MNANATLATRAASIAIVKAVVKRGEKVLSAYMIVSIRFKGWLLLGLARLYCSLSALLLSIVTNGGGHCRITLCLHYTHTKQRCQVFFKFFFRWVWVLGCGCLGVGAWVWVLGCGCLGVGAWVGRWGGAGWGWAGAGWGRLDWDCRCRMARIASLGLPNPNSDCRLGCDG